MEAMLDAHPELGHLICRVKSRMMEVKQST